MNIVELFKFVTDLSLFVLPRLPIVGYIAEQAVEIVSAVADALADERTPEEIVASIRMPKPVDTSRDISFDKTVAAKPFRPA